MVTPQRDRLIVNRVDEFNSLPSEVLDDPTEENGYGLTLLCNLLSNGTRARRINPIRGCKSSKESLSPTTIRRYLLQIPPTLLQSLLSGKLTDDICAAHGPNILIPFPCIYIGGFRTGNQPLTARQMAQIALVIQNGNGTERVIADAYSNNAPGLLGNGVRSAGELTGKIWLDCFEKLGMDLDGIDDDDDASWDVPCPFHVAYVGYSDEPESRFSAHRKCNSLTMILIVGLQTKGPAGVTHVVLAIASQELAQPIEWTGHPASAPGRSSRPGPSPGRSTTRLGLRSR